MNPFHVLLLHVRHCKLCLSSERKDALCPTAHWLTAEWLGISLQDQPLARALSIAELMRHSGTTEVQS